MTTAVAQTDRHEVALSGKSIVGDKRTLQSLLEAGRDTIQKVVPRYLTPEKIMKMVLVAASRNPKLYKCNQSSLLKAVISAAELGLDCSGKLGEGWLVPYWNSQINGLEAQFIAGYMGYIRLMTQHPSVAYVESRIVYEDEEFELEYGSSQKIIHKPRLTKLPEKRTVLGCYALVHFVDGHILPEWMNLSDLMAIKKRALANKRNKAAGPWNTDESEMQRKTVVRRIQKYAPKTPELQALILHDNETDTIDDTWSNALDATFEDVSEDEKPDQPSDRGSQIINKLQTKEEKPSQSDAQPSESDGEETPAASEGGGEGDVATGPENEAGESEPSESKPAEAPDEPAEPPVNEPPDKKEEDDGAGAVENFQKSKSKAKLSAKKLEAVSAGVIESLNYITGGGAERFLKSDEDKKSFADVKAAASSMVEYLKEEGLDNEKAVLEVLGHIHDLEGKIGQINPGVANLVMEKLGAEAEKILSKR
jgi:recombination protein RecT